MFKNKRILIALLSVFGLAASGESASKGMMPDAASYVKQDADLVVWFDTSLAEKKMDPALRKKINSDQNKSLLKNQENDLFNFQNRNVSALINLKVFPGKIFSCTLSGAAAVTGNLSADIENLQKYSLPGKFTLEPEKDRSGKIKKNSYILQFGKLEENNSVRLYLKFDRTGKLLFNGTVNQLNTPKMPSAEKTASRKKENPLVKGINLKQNALVFVARVPVFYPFMKFDNKRNRNLKSILAGIENCQLTLNAASIWIKFRLNAKFNDPAAGELAYRRISDSFKQILVIKEATEYCRNLTIDKETEKNAIRINAEFNLAKLQDALIKLEQMRQKSRSNSNAGKTGTK